MRNSPPGRLRRARTGRRAGQPSRPSRHHRERSKLPGGPVLARFGAGYLGAWLLALVDDAEMQALLAASPQAGRLLRPLWRRLTNDPLPAPLRLPPKPPRSEQPLAPAALAAAPGEVTPDTPPHAPSHASPGQRPVNKSGKPPLSLPWSLFPT